MPYKDEDNTRFFNRAAQVEHDGKKYRLSESDFKKAGGPGNYWHSKTDPSTWLTVATVREARRKFKGKLPRAKIIELCAQALNVTPEKVEHNLDWNANYMAWHDGTEVEFEHQYPQDEE